MSFKVENRRFDDRYFLVTLVCDSPGLAPESGRNVTSFEPPKSSVGDPRLPTGDQGI